MLRNFCSSLFRKYEASYGFEKKLFPKFRKCRGSSFSFRKFRKDFAMSSLLMEHSVELAS